MRITKQQELDRLSYSLLQSNNRVQQLEREIKAIKESKEERKLQMLEKIAYALAQNNEALSKAMLALQGVL